MRLIKVALFILFLLVLQTVVFARLNFFGAAPDLILVSVIIFTVLGSRTEAAFYAAGSGFMQDILCFGIYIHSVLKLAVCLLAGIIKESFVGDNYTLAGGLVALFSPLSLIAEKTWFVFFQGAGFDYSGIFFATLFTTLYNLIMVPFLFPLIKKINYD